VQPRLIPNAIEPRGCLAYGVPAMNEWTLVSATQIPHIVKVTLSSAVRRRLPSPFRRVKTLVRSRTATALLLDTPCS